MIILRPSFQLWWKECRWMGKSYLSPLVSVTKGGNQRGYLLYLVEQRSLEIFYSLRGVSPFVCFFFFSLSYQESHHSNRGSIQKLRISIQRLFLPAFYILVFSPFFLFFFFFFEISFKFFFVTFFFYFISLFSLLFFTIFFFGRIHVILFYNNMIYNYI